MTMTLLIDGNKTSKNYFEKIKNEIDNYVKKGQRPPGLAVILVGNNPASSAYVAMKKKRCAELGIRPFDHEFSENIPEATLLDCITSLNNNPEVDGILVQLPLPAHIDTQKVIEHISPQKDVDGFHPINVGKLLIGLPTFKSCTPYGVCILLEEYNIQTEGKHVVIIGRSNIVGKPLAAMLVQNEKFANATVTICHSHTQNLKALCKQADILIAAIGKPHFVTADMVKQDAVVIDIGINRVNTKDGKKLVGDVDFDAVKDLTSAITPVPGGVGPMTIAMLMYNTLISYKQKGD